MVCKHHQAYNQQKKRFGYSNSAKAFCYSDEIIQKYEKQARYNSDDGHLAWHEA